MDGDDDWKAVMALEGWIPLTEVWPGAPETASVLTPAALMLGKDEEEEVVWVVGLEQHTVVVALVTFEQESDVMFDGLVQVKVVVGLEQDILVTTPSEDWLLTLLDVGSSVLLRPVTPVLLCVSCFRTLSVVTLFSWLAASGDLILSFI